MEGTKRGTTASAVLAPPFRSARARDDETTGSSSVSSIRASSYMSGVAPTTLPTKKSTTTSPKQSVMKASSQSVLGVEMEAGSRFAEDARTKEEPDPLDPVDQSSRRIMEKATTTTKDDKVRVKENDVRMHLKSALSKIRIRGIHQSTRKQNNGGGPPTQVLCSPSSHHERKSEVSSSSDGYSSSLSVPPEVWSGTGRIGNIVSAASFKATIPIHTNPSSSNNIVTEPMQNLLDKNDDEVTDSNAIHEAKVEEMNMNGFQTKLCCSSMEPILEESSLGDDKSLAGKSDSHSSTTNNVLSPPFASRTSASAVDDCAAVAKADRDSSSHARRSMSSPIPVVINASSSFLDQFSPLLSCNALDNTNDTGSLCDESTEEEKMKAEMTSVSSSSPTVHIVNKILRDSSIDRFETEKTKQGVHMLSASEIPSNAVALAFMATSNNMPTTTHEITANDSSSLKKQSRDADQEPLPEEQQTRRQETTSSDNTTGRAAAAAATAANQNNTSTIPSRRPIIANGLAGLTCCCLAPPETDSSTSASSGIAVECIEKNDDEQSQKDNDDDDMKNDNNSKVHGGAEHNNDDIMNYIMNLRMRQRPRYKKPAAFVWEGMELKTDDLSILTVESRERWMKFAAEQQQKQKRKTKKKQGRSNRYLQNIKRLDALVESKLKEYQTRRRQRKEDSTRSSKTTIPMNEKQEQEQEQPQQTVRCALLHEMQDGQEVQLEQPTKAEQMEGKSSYQQRLARWTSWRNRSTAAVCSGMGGSSSSSHKKMTRPRSFLLPRSMVEVHHGDTTTDDTTTEEIDLVFAAIFDNDANDDENQQQLQGEKDGCNNNNNAVVNPPPPELKTIQSMSESPYEVELVSTAGISSSCSSSGGGAGGRFLERRQHSLAKRPDEEASKGTGDLSSGGGGRVVIVESVLASWRQQRRRLSSLKEQ